ncbi:MAG TPA: DNA cytosine methyltransferase [Solirubrobacterales bacterium]|nr:DNA cytosine methyltransferase [Solirubrobacterales bacterium]
METTVRPPAKPRLEISRSSRSQALNRELIPETVDLFCGAGGLSFGLQSAGLSVCAHLDSWTAAVETLNSNFNEQRAPTDVRELTAQNIRSLVGGTPGVLAGGPPCQSFTSAGRRQNDDPRGTLVGVFANLAAAIRPPLVVFENVEGFLTAGGGRFVFDFLAPLIEAGYQVRIRKVNFANFGVPQHRKRVIAIASLLGDPPFPNPTHSAWGAPGAQEIADCPATPTVWETLKDLPHPGSADAPQGHVAPRASRLEQARIDALTPGQTMRDLPEDLWHSSYRKRAFRRVKDGTPTERRGGPPAGLRRLRGDQPSKAITSAAIRELVHPDENRRLTLREAARLQTFPDHFEFQGNGAEQATLIGNAIPPRFAELLGKALIDHLTIHAEAKEHEPGEGGLVEFDVTPAQQMSPALAKVVKAVDAQFTPSLLAAIAA